MWRPWEGIRGRLGRSEGEPWALRDEKVSPGDWRRILCSRGASKWGGETRKSAEQEMVGKIAKAEMGSLLG